jgi:hypothetical protein
MNASNIFWFMNSIWPESDFMYWLPYAFMKTSWFLPFLLFGNLPVFGFIMYISPVLLLNTSCLFSFA